MGKDVTSDTFVKLCSCLSHFRINFLFIYKIKYFLNKYLFTPAGMNQTGYTIPHWKTEDIAVGYSRNNPWGKPNKKNWDKNAPFLNLRGNGGILSSSEEMYKWHLALLGDKILDKKCYNSVLDVDDSVDIVDIFRPSDDVLPFVKDAIKKKPKIPLPRYRRKPTTGKFSNTYKMIKQSHIIYDRIPKHIQVYTTIFATIFNY